MQQLKGLLLITLTTLALQGCGETLERVCAPGQSLACVGPGACIGGQVCAPDGQSFSACQCGLEVPPPADDPGCVGTECGPRPADECVDGESYEYELQLTGFHQPAGEFSRGFDLDDRFSDATDSIGCYEDDYTHPREFDGGVDNAFALVADLAEGVDADLAAADVRVPIRIESFFGIGDPCVSAVIGDTRELLDVSDDQVRLGSDGVATAWFLGPIELHQVSVEGRLSDDGELTDVVVAGRFQVADVVDAFAAFDPTTDPELIETTLGAVADLGPDGDDDCRELSVVFDATVVRR